MFSGNETTLATPDDVDGNDNDGNGNVDYTHSQVLIFRDLFCKDTG